jgi:hypothetical protein
MTSAVLSTFLYKNKEKLGITFSYETDYSVTYENNEYFFIEAFTGQLFIAHKDEDGRPGSMVDNKSRVLNLIRLNI